jgi:hypothetical protein
MSTISPDPMPLHHLQGVARRVLSQTTLDRYAPAFAKMYSDPERRAQAWQALLDREKRRLEFIATSTSHPEPERAQAQLKLALFESLESPRTELEPETAPSSDRASGTPSVPAHRVGAVEATGRVPSESISVARERDANDPVPRTSRKREDHRDRSTSNGSGVATAVRPSADPRAKACPVRPEPAPVDDAPGNWSTRTYGTPDAIFDPRLGLDGLTRLVYVYLCGRANPNGEAGPTMRRVATETGIGDRKVRQAVAALARAGLIEHKPRTHNFRILDPASWPIPASPSPASRAAESAMNGSAWTSSPGPTAPHTDGSASGAA